MEKKEYFKALTGYRAMAAYMVFFTHYDFFSKDTFFYALLASFGLGVPLFFVLSGFLIYNRYHDSKISVPFYIKYMLNRIARIYPIYFLITTATWLFNFKAQAFTAYNIKVYLLNITFLRGFLEIYSRTLVVPGWSLTVEETFYVIAPFLFILGGVNIKKYFIIGLCIYAIGWLLSFFSIDMLNGILWQHHKFMAVSTFFGHSFAFMIGIIIGVLNDRYEKFRFKYFTLIGFLGISISLIIMSQVNNVLGEGTMEVYTWKGIFILTIFSIPFVGALLWGLLHEDTWVRRLFSTDLFQILGKSSYTFYLIHLGIVGSIIRKFITLNTAGVFIIMVVLSIGIWYLIEEPLNEKIRSWGKKLAF